MELTDEQLARIEAAEERQDIARQRRRAQISPVKRGGRRKAENLSLHMSSFWQRDATDRQILHELSRKGRRT